MHHMNLAARPEGEFRIGRIILADAIARVIVEVLGDDDRHIPEDAVGVITIPVANQVHVIFTAWFPLEVPSDGRQRIVGSNAGPQSTFFGNTGQRRAVGRVVVKAGPGYWHAATVKTGHPRIPTIAAVFVDQVEAILVVNILVDVPDDVNVRLNSGNARFDIWSLSPTEELV
jgi:hypothetical protein